MRGKDRGKTGKIEKVLPKEGNVVVAGVNLYKRHLKASTPARPAGIVDIIKPLPASSVLFICPHCKKPSRIGFSFEDNKKVRVCRKCSKVI